ncbi:MAG: transposase [Planctomycetales bacterium]|nr:transposase [Planctomycetales bacterium]
MPPTPMYSAAVAPAYCLRYCWTGWPSDVALPPVPTNLLESIQPAWESDGIRLLESHWVADKVQLTFSTTPQVAPEFLAARVKGRLAYALRQSGQHLAFSRKLAVRSLGDNTRKIVESYIERQVANGRLADPRFTQRIEQFTVTMPQVDLSRPYEVKRGRYWCNLHLVLVVEQRGRMHEQRVLETVRDGAFRVACKKGYAISRLAVMPDHLHVALRAVPSHTPEQVALAFQNNLAYLVGCRLWSDGYYVGTFGEYTMNAVRRESR